MRIAVISDIHGNLDALEAVLEDIRGRGCDRTVCLGDVVGYGADPEECVRLVRAEVWRDSQGEAVVRGNHDDAAAGGDDRYFNPDARLAVRWTREHLSPESIAWLANLPYEIEYEPCLLVHSSPFQPKEWNYVTTLTEAWNAFQCFTRRVAFIGHSHVPFTVSLGENDSHLQVEPDETVSMRSSWRYLVNVGSVGQPRDGDPRACYVSYDSDEGLIERVRVEYPVDQAVEKIRRAGLPSFLADRLLKGR